MSVLFCSYFIPFIQAYMTVLFMCCERKKSKILQRKKNTLSLITLAEKKLMIYHLMFKVRVMSDNVFFFWRILDFFSPSQHMNWTVLYAWMNGMKKTKKNIWSWGRSVLTCRIHYVQKEYITMVVTHSTFGFKYSSIRYDFKLNIV